MIDIEVINIDDINDAYDRIEKGKARFRYVINMASLAPTDR
jgi:alcohol dehydrogenase (NADP+)